MNLMIDILIPVLARPQNVEPLLENIEWATRVEHNVIFIATKGDKEEIDELKRCEATFLVYPHPAGRADFAKKINWAFPKTKAPWVFQGADDLRFHRSWDTKALSTAKVRHAGVIGTDDLGNPLVKRGAHSTHTLIKREYIEKYGGTHDGTGLVFCELYDHEFTDNEFVQTAIRRGQWAFSKQSKVEHLHPVWRKAEMDSTYEKAFRSSKPDYMLFQRRMRAGRTPEERRQVYKLNREIRMEMREEARRETARQREEIREARRLGQKRSKSQ